MTTHLHGFAAHGEPLPPVEGLQRVPAGTVLEASADAPIRLHFDSVRFRERQELWVRLILPSGQVIHAPRVKLHGPSEFGPCDPLPGRPTAVCLLVTAAPVEILE